MRFFAFGLRGVVVCLSLLCALLVSGNAALAQGPTVIVSTAPGSLAFGVPTGSTVSAEQSVTISVTGSGSATISAFSIVQSGPTDYSADFAITSKTCTDPDTLSAPGSCSVGITFTPHTATGILESASLTFSKGTGTVTVPLTGALGAIKLFDEFDVATSNPAASLNNPFAYGSNTLNLSCPAGGQNSPVIAILSNTPDGVGNVLEDNYISVFVNGSPVGAGAPAGNVCTGPLNDMNGNITQLVCFTQAYRTPAGSNQLNGTNSDSITNANTILAPVNGNSAGGVPPIDIHLLLSGLEGTTPVRFSLLDGGGFVAGSTLFLKTNCTPGAIVPGGTLSGNPIDPTNPASLAPKFNFNSTQGSQIGFSADYTANANNPTNAPTPSVTDVGIPQSQFYKLVAGGNAGPAVCLRLSGEVDPVSGEILCKGFLLQCTVGSSTSGGNCPQSTIDNLKFQAKYDSPDAQVPSAANNYNNFLPDGANASGSACHFYLLPAVQNGACASGTGPGLLEGNDTWASGAYAACAFVVSSDPLFGQVCPQNPITAFHGANDPGHTVTTKNTNSLFVPVVNMPLPTDTITLPGQNNWVTATTNIQIPFTANPATYSPAANNPFPAAPPLAPGNGFTPANIKSETYGIAPVTSPASDPDGQNPSDIAVSNGVCVGLPGGPNNGGSFSSTFTLAPSTPLSEGIYNLHHYATDCANTEGLVYKPTFDPTTNTGQLVDPNANWASFPVTQIGVDTTRPQFSCASPSTSVWYNSNVTNISCTVTDAGQVGVSGSGFGPAVNGIQGSLSTIILVSTSVPSNASNSAANALPAPVSPTLEQPGCDLAGNCTLTPVSAGPFMIDMVNPTIAGPTFSVTGTTFLVGQSVKVTYGCADDVGGSGVASCIGTLSSGSFIDTSATALGPHTFTVNATDNAGNHAVSSVNYTVSYAQADLALVAGSLPAASVKSGTYITYGLIAKNQGPSAALGVTVKDTLPTGATFSSGYILNGLKLTSCSSSAGVVTCPVGNLNNGASVLAYITIRVPTTPGTVNNTIAIGGLNPDPKPSNNSVTVKTTVTK